MNKENAQESTQVARALKELDIEPIYALSPQAKGRIERVWKTLQDRLVFELRLAGASTQRQANAVLDAYRLIYNKRFAHKANDSRCAWRARPNLIEMRRICAFSYEKRVRNDNTVAHFGALIDLAPAAHHTAYAGSVVCLRHQLSDKVRFYSNERLIIEVDMVTPSKAPPRTRATRHAAGRRPAAKKNMTF